MYGFVTLIESHGQWSIIKSRQLPVENIWELLGVVTISRNPGGLALQGQTPIGRPLPRRNCGDLIMSLQLLPAVARLWGASSFPSKKVGKEEAAHNSVM